MATIRPVGMTLDRALEIATASLPTTPGRPARLPVSDADIRLLHGRGWSDVRIAVELHASRPTVRDRRNRMGLPRNDKRGRTAQKESK